MNEKQEIAKLKKDIEEQTNINKALLELVEKLMNSRTRILEMVKN